MCSDMQEGWTALMWAAARGKCDVLTELISLGADVDIQDNVSLIFLCLIITLPNGSGLSECTVCYDYNDLYSCRKYFTYGILSS